MQFYNCLNVIIGIAVLLAANSNAAVAQQSYFPPAPSYGYAPAPSYGAYPSPGYPNGFYDQGFSHPVLPVQTAPQFVPSNGVPENSVPVTDAAQFAPGSSASNLNPSVQEQLENSESQTTEFENSGSGSVDQLPSAASILGLENGLKKLAPPTNQFVESSEPTDIAAETTMQPKIVAPSVPAAEPKSPNSQTPTSEPLAKLLAIQSKIDAVLPRLLPAVVAIEGGSGVIVSPNGHILTASHVTKKAGRTVFVRLADGRSAQAITLGTNVNSDTAALKLIGNGPWPFVQPGDSSQIQLGDWCLTFGYPLSFERGQPAAIRIGRILQKSQARFVTDSPIMGGDSGGPLFDLNGGLIAISSRIRNDVSKNIFVPIERYQTEWRQLISSVDVPKIKRSQPKSYLGILGETDFDRVRIRRVYQGSPAAKAGLLENDVIVSFGGRRVGNFDDVASVLKSSRPGQEVIAQLNRYGTLISISVRLGSNEGG